MSEKAKVRSEKEYDKKDLSDLVESLFVEHDRIEGVVIRVAKIYLSPSQIFACWISALKYKLFGRF